MRDIKPIETRWKGYRFRSRLEARWAVFFEAAAIPWEYESEGFDIGEGRKYLPDFHLTRQDLWLEIKPKDIETIDRNEWVRAFIGAAWFSKNCDKIVGVCIGNPWPGEYDVSVSWRGNPDSIIGGQWAMDRKDDNCLWILNEKTMAASQLNTASIDHDKYPMTTHPRLMQAYEAARGARFEHGEQPRI
jgi:hypothetical protein